MAVTALIDRALDAGGEPLSDHLLVELHARTRPAGAAPDATPHDSVFVLVSDDDLIAYGQASPAGGSWVLGLVIDPAASPSTTASSTLAGDVLCALVAGIAEHGGGRATWWVGEADPHLDAARTAGLEPGRVLLHMRRPLPLDEHSDVAHRAFRPGVDEAAWLTVNNRAFDGRDEQGSWTADTLALRMAEPWFDADGVRVLDDDDGRMIGFCWTKVHQRTHTDPELGEIYVIGVDPDAHGRGLGRQLTLAGLDHLASRGVRTGMLYVDAANEPAVRLYENLGFVVHHREFAFTAEVASARDGSVGAVR
jgi:mycothiol synthase